MDPPRGYDSRHAPPTPLPIASDLPHAMLPISHSEPQSQVEGASNALPSVSSTPTPTGPLSAADIQDTVDRIRANQDYQAVLQLALRSLEKSIARNHDLQVRSIRSSSCSYLLNTPFFMVYRCCLYPLLTVRVVPAVLCPWNDPESVSEGNGR